MKRYALITIVVIFILFAIFCARVAQIVYTPLEIHHTIVDIRPGYNARQISNVLYEKKVIKNKQIFFALIRIKEIDRNLKAGQYLFSGYLGMLDIIEKIVSGEILVERVTIPEGLSIYRTFRILSNRGIGSYERYLELAKDPEFASELTGFDIVNLEGFLYPDTYIFGHEMTEENVLRAMVRNFFNRLHMAHICIEDQDQFYRDLILASIVEREAIFNDEKPKIAGVYLNRMRIGMRLQADPTVVYHLEPYFIHRRIVTYRDTRTPTPHNTYMISGLPPYPISNPATSSIFAVQNPDPSPYLFFFARRGRHIFTTNYADHLRRQRETRNLQ
jgi:UPF0755 protein